MGIEIKSLYINSYGRAPEIIGFMAMETLPLKEPVLRSLLERLMEDADTSARIGFFNKGGKLTGGITATALREKRDSKSEKGFEKFTRSTIRKMKKANSIHMRRGSFRSFPSW